MTVLRFPWLWFAVAAALAGFYLFPVYWMYVTSLKGASEKPAIGASTARPEARRERWKSSLVTIARGDCSRGPPRLLGPRHEGYMAATREKSSRA